MLRRLAGNGSSSQTRSSYVGKTYHLESYRLVVEDVVAEGGFAVVLCVRAGNGRRYALKRMAINSEQDLYLARQEIAITKALSDCPYSVTFVASSIRLIAPEIHEVLILLELYTGGRVVELMNAHTAKGFSEEEVLKIFTDVCQAVARLHHRTKPIIHRDLKVENILRSKAGSYVLCDYGSCSVQPMHPEVLGATECQEQIARFTTLAYRAPEMVSLYSGKTISTKADIWALGCLLYKLCFFTTPFGEQPLAIVSVQFSIPATSCYSAGLHSLISYMLEADPDKRPSIWQVCHVAFRLHQLPNPVANVFSCVRPSSLLPSQEPTPPRVSLPSPSSSSSRAVAVAAAEGASVRAKTTPVLTSISSRERPKPRPLPAGGSGRRSSSPPTQHLQPPRMTTAELSKSLDRGLDAFGDTPFTSQSNQQQQQRGSVGKDAFGATPFKSPPQSTRTDLFGAPPFHPVESNCSSS